ncbi:acyl-CoA thioesterase [Nocardioides sediminis]|uniref:acyl-CoA thioesterase n=1 Tax=Nocardioides sediminis TaxID=433648 RepID=UPI001F269E3C|nr:thioesterase family protein [Nocardioides sediminis]
MRHRYECPLRWADLDLLGHVNNVVYVDYLQEARVDMLRTHAPDRRADELAEGVVVVRHEVSYLAPLTFRFGPVSIECWVTEVRAASFTMAYEIFDEDESGTRTTYVRASTVLTPYVFATERPRRLTAEEKDVLAPFVEESGPKSARIAPVTAWEPGHFALHVRFSDVDVYGHVNNVKYFEYLQEARIPLMADLVEHLPGAGDIRVVVAQTDVDYKVPILFRPEPYDVWSRVTHVGTRSFTVESEIRDGETVLSRARVVLVCFDPVTGRSVDPGPEHRAAMTAALEA